MKKLYLLILTFSLSIVASLAFPKFEAGKRYHIICQWSPNGCVVDGASVGQNTPLYYLRTATQSDEAAWYIETAEYGGFNIINVKTGQYVTYDGVRQDSPELRRYVSMTDRPDGDNSAWYFSLLDDGDYEICNMAHDEQIWDLRESSYCVGTYNNPNYPNRNQIFYFTDEDGNRVPERQPNDMG